MTAAENSIHRVSMEEDVEIIVGDEKQQEFFPRVKIKRWDNEVNFSVGVVSGHTGTHQIVKNKVVWNDGHDIISMFYKKPDNQFEFEIELATKPISNVIDLSIKTKGLDFWYQPPLTQEQIDGGHRRPENVVGSYAVYHKTKHGDYTQLGGKNYRAGKAFHIYRPFATDAANNSTWCDLHIDEDNERLTITIDDDWLNTAVYPVMIDPTFGVDPGSPGGSTDYLPASDALGSLHTTPADIGTAQSITAYIALDVGHFYIKGMFVLHSSLNIIANGTGSPGYNGSGGFAWTESDFAVDPSPTPSTEHLLMIIADLDTNLAYDSGNVNQGHEDSTNSYASPANLGTITHNDRLYSIYCTYTLSGRTTKNTRATMSVHHGVMFQTITSGHGY